MERKNVSNYASAYKFSGILSASDTKSQRVKRRSVEQKDLRQNLVNRKRKIGLSPLQEGDTTVKDKSSIATTPRRPKDDKNQAGMNRLEQLKKWKAERELKRKQELEKRKKEPFRYRKLSHKDQDLFGKTQSVAKHPVKPIPAPVQVPAVKKPQSKQIENHEKNNHKKTDKVTKPLPAKSYERPTKGSMARSVPDDKKGQPTRKTRNQSKEGRGGIPEQKQMSGTVSSHMAGSKRISRPVETEAEKPTRTTRQSSRNKNTGSTAAKKDVQPAEELNLIKVSTSRGDRLDSTESFAPNDYTFNAASFVFKPLSPNSAAGFLNPGQDTSCSFLEHNPKISSTPKGGKKRQISRSKQESDTGSQKSHTEGKPSKNDSAESRNSSTGNKCVIQSSDSMEVEDNKDDTSSSTEQNETVKSEAMSFDKPESKQNTTIIEKQKDPVRRSTSVKHSKGETLNVTVGNTATAAEKQDVTQNAAVREKQKTPLRRSSRRSVLSSSVSQEEPDMEPENKKQSCASVTESETKEKESGNLVIQSEPRKTRGSTRSSGTDGGKLDVTKSEKKTSRKSVSKEFRQDELETSAKKPKQSTRKSVLISREAVSIPEIVHEDHEEDDVFVLPTEKTTNTLSEVGVNAVRNLKKTDSNTKSLVFVEEEDKRTPGVRRGKSRNKSFGGFRLPDTQCAALSASAKRRQRKSVMPRSPEEWVDLLSKSPMIEMTRRTPKIAPGNSSLTAIDFDDVDLSASPVTDKDAQKVAENGTVASAMPENPKLNLFQALEESENKDIKRIQDDSQRSETDSEVDSEIAETTGAQREDDGCEKSKKDSQSDSKIAENNGEKVVVDADSSSSNSGKPGSDEERSAVHDVKYFRKLLKNETSRLQELCSHWEEVNKTNDLTEEVSGQIRTTVGQAVLLMNQRFKQFTGLVDNCEFKTGEKETTCTDLDGFWDMIYFQVEDVDTKFEKLKKLQSNNWIEDKPKPETKKTKKKVTKPAVSKPVVKSKFAAFRAQMKKKQEIAQSPGVVTAVEEEKVFEMPGFFRVASPVRSPAFHCEAGTPKKSCTPTVENKEPEKEKPEKEKLTVPPPSSNELLMKRTPARKKSYAPAVPSPLLVDSTPQPRPTRSCTKKTPLPRQLLNEDVSLEKNSDQKTEEEGKTSAKTTPRRSIRARKSVNFTEEVPSTTPKSPLPSETEVTDGNTDPELDRNNVSEEKFVDDNAFAMYLLPMSALYNNSEKENSPRPAKRRRTSSSLKACPSANRRKSSQTKKVHFDSPAAENSPSVRLPRTPFNKEPVERRVTRHSLSQNQENQDIFNVDCYNDSPRRTTKSSRPSLLYTPPDLPPRPTRPLAEVPTATLISFTP